VIAFPPAGYTTFKSRSFKGTMKMKVSALIALLANYRPDVEVTGIEHLHISAPIVEAVPQGRGKAPTRKINHFLKGEKRKAAATAPGPASEVAERFHTTPEYIMLLRKQVLNGIFRERTLELKAKQETLI